MRPAREVLPDQVPWAEESATSRPVAMIRTSMSRPSSPVLAVEPSFPMLRTTLPTRAMARRGMKMWGRAGTTRRWLTIRRLTTPAPTMYRSTTATAASMMAEADSIAAGIRCRNGRLARQQFFKGIAGGGDTTLRLHFFLDQIGQLLEARLRNEALQGVGCAIGRIAIAWKCKGGTEALHAGCVVGLVPSEGNNQHGASGLHGLAGGAGSALVGDDCCVREDLGVGRVSNREQVRRGGDGAGVGTDEEGAAADAAGGFDAHAVE